MGLLKAASSKLFAIFLALVAVFRRAMCFLGRRRKNSGSLLPTTVNKYPITSLGNDVTQSVPGNEVELEDWNSWGNDSMQGSRDSGDIMTTSNSHYNNGGGFISKHQAAPAVAPTPEEEAELDYFQGMEPSYIKTQKILIKKREEFVGNSNSISSRLAVNVGALQESELGSWEDSDNAWEADISDDLTWEAQEAIKEKRRQERERRAAEHQRRKYERDNQRASGRRDAAGIGMKLS
ncbi:receptor-binding cancer antigen expressed on SiSo cells-like [Tubulanus polymorphus]|uniref:receptor-binding cancer antigen expressed on SiSo cells-like n=1 Tax=Tubulanus polymorphus TaxID=672921 RepID=UPI003DA3DED6